MRLIAALFSLHLVWLSSLLSVTAQEKRRDSIILLKHGAKALDFAQNARVTLNLIKCEWEGVINGLAASLDDSDIARLRQDDRVEVVVDDTQVSAFVDVTQWALGLRISTNSPWGLARLSSIPTLPNQNSSALNFTYTYDSTGGAGVNVYVLDTGIRTTHIEFGGRARWGATFGGHSNTDGNGHGTHCSGIVAGATYGVAKRASLVAVRVLSDQGSGATSDIISGINWIVQDARASSRPSVILIALGGVANVALDRAVTSAISSGIHVVVAAGGSNTDVFQTSPARVPEAITVGASTIADSRASSSNYGSGVDVYAPGTNILSAWHTSDIATATRSWTSMAAAHVAGLVADIIGLEGNAAPAEMHEKIKDWALKGVLSGIPSGSRGDLAHNKRAS